MVINTLRARDTLRASARRPALAGTAGSYGVMSLSLSPRSQLVFYTQALPALTVASIAAFGVALVHLRVPPKIALLSMIVVLALGLAGAIATHRTSEVKIEKLIIELCNTGGWANLGSVISALASRLPTGAARDLLLLKHLLGAILSSKTPPQLSNLQRRQLIWLVLAVRSIEDVAFFDGVEAILHVERDLPRSALVRRDLSGLAPYDVRIKELR